MYNCEFLGSYPTAPCQVLTRRQQLERKKEKKDNEKSTKEKGEDDHDDVQHMKRPAA